jgi:pSer/pThr/pTyr-binding forkhead associated (FHA) protein/outer membrane protein assembly factor BamB
MVSDKTQIRRVDTQWQLISDAGDIVALKDTVRVGREKDNDVVLTEGAVSRYHATIELIAGIPIITDNRSANGTFVNGVACDKSQLKAGDKILFDVVGYVVSTIEDTTNETIVSAKTEVYKAPVSIEKTAIIEPDENIKTGVWQAANVADGGTLIMSGSDSAQLRKLHVTDTKSIDLIGIDDPVAGRSFSLNKERLSIGRSPLSDIIIKSNSVSSHHADLELIGTEWHLSDQDSSNGSYVNGHEIDSSVVKSGDRIKIGEVQLDFDPSGSIAPSSTKVAREASTSNHMALFAGIGAGILVALLFIAWLLTKQVEEISAVDVKSPVINKSLIMLWSKTLVSGRVYMQPIVADIRDDKLAELIFADDKGILSIRDSRTGAEITRVEGLGSSFSAPPLAIKLPSNDKHQLVVASVDSRVSLLNGFGQAIWSTNLGVVSKGVFTQPLFVDVDSEGMIVVPTMGRGMVALSSVDGSILWDTTAVGAMDLLTRPVFIDGKLLLVTRVGEVMSMTVDSRSPSLIWKTNLPNGELPLAIMPVGSSVLVTTNEGTLTLLNSVNGEIIWQNSLAEIIFSAPQLLNNNIIVVSQLGDVKVLNINDGQVSNSVALGAEVQANMAKWDEELLILDSHGRLHQVDADGRLISTQRSLKADEFVQAPWVGDIDNDAETDVVTIALNGVLTRYTHK